MRNRLIVINVDPEMSSSLIAGAVAVPEGRDAGIAGHYGDPFGEQRALARAAGVVDRSNRDVITVTGVDRLSWLHSIITQHVSDLADGESTEALVLSPPGHIEQHWQLTELGETVWLSLDPGVTGGGRQYTTP